MPSSTSASPNGAGASAAPPPFSALRAEAGPEPAPLRAAITANCRCDETGAVRRLLRELAPAGASAKAAESLARELAAGVRARGGPSSGIGALMSEYSLSSEEGVALMCLAEAMLRVPDEPTADRLIADKIGKGDWKKHLGGSPSLFVNAATWGLMITGRLVATSSRQGLSAALTRLVAQGGEPLIRKGVDLAMRMLGRQFVIAETIEEALIVAGRARHPAGAAHRYRYSFDMLGEAALTAASAAVHYGAYEGAIRAIGAAANCADLREADGVSVKLSALHPRYARPQRARVLAELLPRLARLARLARRQRIGITIDAEEADRLELSLDLFERLALDPALSGYSGLGFVVQAYQKRAPYVIDYLIDLARRSGTRFMVRLVKGAYWDAEIKRAQVDGAAAYPVYTRKAYTDVAYLACARRLLRAGDAVYPQFATHNAHTLATVYTWARELGAEDFEFQCLHGMGEALYDQVVGPSGLGIACRIYAPVGSHETLLAYLVRRLLENGANSSFLNRIADDRIAIDELIADPIELSAAWDGAPHPEIPLPACLFAPERANSRGIDFSDDSALRELAAEFESRYGRIEARPLVSGAGRGEAPGTPRLVRNPADRSDWAGSVIDADEAAIEAALAAAAAAAKDWASLEAPERAGVLNRAADLFEQHRSELMALAIREAGKSLPNALAEVREAVDSLRYYAAGIVSMPAAAPLGPVACISPWNFPLAIFAGEVGAALAAGNVVLAKPAEQTPLTAYRAVQLLHEAGVPLQALQFLPGDGEKVGGRLVADSRVQGVVFTGSTEVAAIINRTLARRAASQAGEIPLIAETGGLNAMIVDSTALPEQVVQDVLASAFDSAGQRCSSLRLLCLQEDIADKVLGLLAGAMRELRIGNPDRLETDVGPVIDEPARAGLARHVEAMRARGFRVIDLPLPRECASGTFFPPTVIEIASASDLSSEVFGPILHVCRFRGDELPRLVAAINATGYGLTLGIQSRIDETIQAIAGGARVGNLYVNRNMIGAVVGVQPFGGEGKSGTGPKAGGPLYLRRLQRDPVDSFPREGLTGEHAAGESRERNGLLDALADWASAAGHPVAGLARHYAATTLLDRTLSLPGPTGEQNTLGFAPRGTVFCAASGANALLNQIAAAWATGNRIAIPRESEAWLPQDLPASLRAAIRCADEPVPTECAAAMIDLPSPGDLFQALAARPGALITTILTRGPAPIPLWRLVVERARCINTAATGGNAALLALSE